MKSQTKLYIISGERSGDLHASNLVLALKAQNPNLAVRGMGGSYSEKAGVELAVDYSDVALMGFLEVVLGFRKVLNYLKLVKKDILAYNPDAIILVDYGGFNMKIAAFAKENKIPVHYYIPPKVWAWNQKRALKLKAFTDHIYSILPFETSFFEKYDLKVNYVGNPLLDEINKFEAHQFFFQKNELSYQPIIALLPGSRKQEINAMLDRMIALVKEFPNAQFVIAGVGDLGQEIYQRGLEAGIRVIYDQTYDLLSHAVAAVVTSGTATLETALFRVPQVVVYRTSAISYAIAKNLIMVPFISLPNLIAEYEVVKELIQSDFSIAKVKAELQQILSNQIYKGHMLQGYDLIKARIGSQSASETTAKLILESLD
ncbi:lipid-A-disaccharide synthase [Algoriphagus halophytocola]|uniref:Lipid-A-disaccharide synthase n=1 Tax=Algoriphagus halophytocola TaxID=2991499 RepID=A0ABY6MHS3_9BACT|nr:MULTISPECIES: lipid-A-disaccharide synthase [unclassified Algoriphagus]UZD22529.1 lipid-A-disaccharide synthase [Algoriphagus sp. TR-M5]WBL43792.1 lipid-A-disaccharide synthase [Algoriphagus sp. TR-M9]